MTPKTSTLLGLLFGSILISGCTSPAPAAQADDDSISFGLGLAVPVELPRPASFAEPAEEMQRLEGFLREEADAILGACGSAHPLNATFKILDEGHHLTALDELETACSQPARDTVWDVADDAMSNGSENDTYQTLRAAALDAMMNLTERLDAHPAPGSVVEAALLGKLASMHRSWADSIDTSALYFGPYQDGTARDGLQLRNVYGNLIVAPVAMNLLLEILDRYPWRETPCQSPDLDDLKSEALSLVNQAISLAEELADPEDANYVSTVYGGLVKGHKPHIEYYAEHDWWPGLLYKKMLMEWDIAYWENYTADPVPTQEEAQFLVAQYRNETRTLWTERTLRGVVERVHYEGFPWEESHPATTIKVLTLPALQDPYMQLDCPDHGETEGGQA